jgi:hypothetical protein
MKATRYIFAGVLTLALAAAAAAQGGVALRLESGQEPRSQQPPELNRLRAEIERMRARIGELEKRLGQATTPRLAVPSTPGPGGPTGGAMRAAMPRQPQPPAGARSAGVPPVAAVPGVPPTPPQTRARVGRPVQEPAPAQVAPPARARVARPVPQPPQVEPPATPTPPRVWREQVQERMRAGDHADRRAFGARRWGARHPRVVILHLGAEGMGIGAARGAGLARRRALGGQAGGSCPFCPHCRGTKGGDAGVGSVPAPRATAARRGQAASKAPAVEVRRYETQTVPYRITMPTRVFELRGVEKGQKAERGKVETRSLIKERIDEPEIDADVVPILSLSRRVSL